MEDVHRPAGNQEVSMKPDNKSYQQLLDRQNQAMRDPYQVICGSYEMHGIVPASLEYELEGRFLSLLEKLRLTLLVSREYEHLLIALRAQGRKLQQSFLHLPHPNGIVVNHRTDKVYVASTRSPNQIVELSLVSSLMPRDGYKSKVKKGNYLVPSRIKYYAGAYYFHDLAIIGGRLYANSVGKNGVIQINMDRAASEEVVWSPLPESMRNTNHLQLNSIAAGPSLAASYFSASAEQPGEYKPGDLRFPVDQKGVIFHGKTRKVIARGLTRPHSAKLHRGKLWVNNSGYGEFGFIENGSLQVGIKFGGWTRGLCFFDNIAFVGVSKIIPKFKAYAPGISSENQECAVYAVDIDKQKILGAIRWPWGNQIYGIECMDTAKCSGFPFTQAGLSAEDEKDFFFRHLIT